MPRCYECRKGDHEADYGPPIGLFDLRDPDAPGRIVARGYLCEEHAVAKDDDGYILTRVGGAR